MTELLLKRLHDGATLPTRAYEGDAGLDLSACERVELGPGERAVVGTGLTVAIPDGHAGFVQPRSGLAAPAPCPLVRCGRFTSPSSSATS